MQTSAVRAPSRSRGRPSVEDALQLTELITGIAQELFFSIGFESTSIDEIVQRAKISKKTFYARFSDKAALFEAVLTKVARGRFGSAPEAPIGPVAAALYSFTLDLLQKLLEPEVLAIERAVFASLHKFPRLAQSIEREKAPLVAGVVHILNEAVRAGELEIDDVNRAANRYFDGAIAPRFRSASFGLSGLTVTEQDKAELNSFIRFFLRGYAPSPVSEEGCRRMKQSTKARASRP